MTEIDLDALEALANAATPTPWRWAGNTDHEDPRIEGGPRRHYVMGVLRREREKGDRQAQDFERYMQECEQFDPSLNDGKGGYRYLTEQEIADAVRGDWLSEPNGEPRHDDRLSFINVDTKLMEYARDLAVYAVCPDATSRDDERVYRADITGVRNPNAELMVAAVNALPQLIAELRLLREQVALYAPIARPILADIEYRKRRAERLAAHTHYCWACSDGSAKGEGCLNCRQTGFEQMPCVNCPGPQPAAASAHPSNLEAQK